MVGKGIYRTKDEKAKIVLEILSNTVPISEIRIRNGREHTQENRY